uniref:Putative transmembrane protein n=1 Tax=Ralstonia solanacearum TaxID=305 RepID=A0A0S4UI60_RALSL|nr:putative transmembrane protein [Ralstonia solanacearum]CUV35348.1 putative transmembrane protein [Ralstonia solanacearum]CUV40825.1 putative transmembrane protein [Ralstonia solanacearum]CUV64236.1 putative transmembrane protein [Ralstonia solanacearum]
MCCGLLEAFGYGVAATVGRAACILGAVGNAVAGTIAAIGRPPFVML